MRCGKRVKYWQIIFHIDWKCQQFCSTAWCCVCLPACAVNLLWWVIVMSSICFSPGIRCLRKIVVSSTCWWTNEWLIWSPWLAKGMTLSTYHIAMDWQASTPILCHFQWHILVVTHKHTRKPFDVVSVAKTIQNCSSTGRGLICHLICILQASLVLNRIECRRKNFSVTFFFRNELKTIPKGFFFLFYSVLLDTVGVGWMCYRMLTAIRLRLISMPPQTISVHREYACSMFGLAWRCLLSYGRCLWNDMGRLLLALALVCWWYADVTEIRFRAMQIEDRI